MVSTRIVLPLVLLLACLLSAVVWAVDETNLHALLAASVVVFGLGAFLVVRLALRPFRVLAECVNKLVRTGDLREGLPAADGNDELGALTAAFADMVGKLRDALGGLQSSGTILDDSTVALSKSTDVQGQTLSRQASALHQTQVTANEIKAISLSTSEQAEHALQTMARADAISRAGEEAIADSFSGLEEIRERVQEIAAKIAKLNERAQQIGSIAQTVKNLADQSNMLALNAAIEAVRSGEHGQGFSVVANEIRSLADQSITATSRVRDIVADITEAIGEAVTITHSGVERIEAGFIQMKSSGDSLRELSSIVRANSGTVKQIATAVTQQNEGITQIFAAVSDLSAMMDDSLQCLQATTSASSRVREVSQLTAAIAAAYRV